MVGNSKKLTVQLKMIGEKFVISKIVHLYLHRVYEVNTLITPK